MNKKSLSIGVLSIFSLVMLLGLTSAAVNFLDSENAVVTSLTTSGNPGDTVTISFKVQEKGYGNLTDITFNTPLTLTQGSDSFNTSNTISGAITSLDQDQTSGLMSLSINIPSDQLAGDYDGTLTLSGTYTGSVNYDIPVTVTVNEEPGLEVSDLTIPQGSTSGTITITNTGNTNLTNIDLSYSGDFDISFSVDPIASLAPGASQDILVTITNSRDIDLANNQVIVRATSGSTSATGTVTVDTSYCSSSNNGNLDVQIRNIDVTSGYGSNEDWYPLDEVEVEVRVRNRGNWDIRNVEIEWGLYSTYDKDFVIDDSESDFDLREGDDETVVIKFKLDHPSDYENGDFTFYAKATGEIDDSHSEYDGDDTCQEDSQSINMVTQRDFVTLSDIDFPNSTTCGANAQITADVWNIGTRDQKDLSVILYNKELGINEKKTFDKINSFDNDEVIFNIKIPEDADAKSYILRMEVKDDDGDIYESDDDDEAIFNLIFNVEGECGEISEQDVLITASLESGGKAGEPLIVKATVTNTGSRSGTFTFDVSDYSTWADLDDIDNKILLLEAGASKDVNIKFDVNKDAVGDKTFKIKVTEGSTIVEQPVTVTIEKTSGFFGTMTGSAIGGSTYLWGLGIINIILVILIIIVAVRLIRK